MLLDSIRTEILVPVVALVFALALIYFFWGMVQYMMNLNNPTARQDGQRHMFWGVIGLAIMLSAFGIIQFVFNTVSQNGEQTGLDGNTIEKPQILLDESIAPQ